MTTSSSTVWELTRDQIIAGALRKIGVLGKGQTPDTEDITNAQIALNGIIARFNTLGMPLWKRTEALVPLIANTIDYALPDALKLTEVYLRNTFSSVQYKIQLRSLYDIKNMPYSSTGIPVAYAFQPTLLEGGTLTIWPKPTATEVTNYSLIVIYQEELDTFTASTQTPDFPAYWTDALVYGLAYALAPEFGIPLGDRQALGKDAMLFLAQAQSYGDEDGSIIFSPERK